MNSHLPVGRLAEHLESLSRERIWLATVATTAGISILDLAAAEIGFMPLYIVFICRACWALGAREGLA